MLRAAGVGARAAPRVGRRHTGVGRAVGACGVQRRPLIVWAAARSRSAAPRAAAQRLVGQPCSDLGMCVERRLARRGDRCPSMS